MDTPTIRRFSFKKFICDLIMSLEKLAIIRYNCLGKKLQKITFTLNFNQFYIEYYILILEKSSVENRKNLKINNLNKI